MTWKNDFSVFFFHAMGVVGCHWKAAKHAMGYLKDLLKVAKCPSSVQNLNTRLTPSHRCRFFCCTFFSEYQCNSKTSWHGRAVLCSSHIVGRHMQFVPHANQLGGTKVLRMIS